MVLLSPVICLIMAYLRSLQAEDTSTSSKPRKVHQPYLFPQLQSSASFLSTFRRDIVIVGLEYSRYEVSKLCQFISVNYCSHVSLCCQLPQLNFLSVNSAVYLFVLINHRSLESHPLQLYGYTTRSTSINAMLDHNLNFSECVEQ